MSKLHVLGRGFGTDRTFITSVRPALRSVGGLGDRT